jgi:hypothetical protein
MRTVLVAILALVLAPAVAQAGGGAKPNSTIRVRNNSSATLGVAVDPSANLDAALNSAAGITSTGQFVSLGGRIVGPNATISIPVRAGAHTIAAAYFNTAGGSVTAADVATESVSVTKGKTATVNVSGGVGIVPTITVP